MRIDGRNSEASGCHVLLIASSCEECPDYHMGTPILEDVVIPIDFSVPNFHECSTIENLLWPETLRLESGECHESVRRCVYYDEDIPNYVFVQTDKPPPPDGACCDGEGGCSQATEAACVAGGGSWQGAGTDCCADVVASEDCPRTYTPPFCTYLPDSDFPGDSYVAIQFNPNTLCPGIISVGFANPMNITISGTPGVNIVVGGVSYSAGVSMDEVFSVDPAVGLLLESPTNSNLAGQLPLTVCFQDA